MWIQQLILVLIGTSAGILVSGGLFAFIIGLGVVSDLADRTHTGKYILLYETMIAAGGFLGNIFYIFQIQLIPITFLLGIYGLFAGIFMGCWTMAIAEVLKVFPIFIRRARLHRMISYMILGVAVGKGVGALLYFWKGW